MFSVLTTHFSVLRPAAKRTKIEDLLCIRGVSPPPPAPPSTLSASMREEIKHIWITIYAPGIDKFLETRWFGLRGLTHLMRNPRLCDQFSVLIQRYSMNPQDPNYFQHLSVTQSLEATVVWAMMSMCRLVVSKEEKADEQEVKDGVLDAAKRLEIFEALVSGEYLEGSSAPEHPSAEGNGTALNEQMKSREHEFWRLVHTFLTIRDDEASAAKEIDETLKSCRALLDSRENRDVVYSVMIARHLGARQAESLDDLPQPGGNEEQKTNQEQKTMLLVAKRFIEDETVKGTNQVVQRLCGMASTSWNIKH